MNKARRKELGDLMDRLTALKPALEALTDARCIHDELSSVRDDEQEAFDAMPESMQNGDRGTAMSEGIGAMEEVISLLDTLADAMESCDVDDMLSNIDNARGES